MKRNMDLIRVLLLKLESIEARPGDVFLFHLDDQDLRIEGYTAEQIYYHMDLLEEAGFIVGANGAKPMDGHIFQRLSYSGHDFVDSVRSDEVWNRTKKGVEEAGGFTLDLLKDLAKGFIRKQIADKTGIEI